MKTLLLAIFLCGPSFALAGEESFQLQTARGDIIHVQVAFPEGAEKVPAVVAAPGRGYHMGLPIYQEMRALASGQKIAIFTFNWSFFTKGTPPSPGQKDELEDLQTVIAFAKTHGRVDPNRLIVSGKSFGSVIAYRAFSADPSAFGLHLLTPLCETEEMMGSYYPQLAAQTKPVLFAFGTSDEACNATVVKKLLAAAGSNLALLMVPGGHSFELGPFDDPAYEEINAANVKTVVEMIVHWARVQLKK